MGKEDVLKMLAKRLPEEIKDSKDALEMAKAMEEHDEYDDMACHLLELAEEELSHAEYIVMELTENHMQVPEEYTKEIDELSKHIDDLKYIFR